MSSRNGADRRENQTPDSMWCCSSMVRAGIFMGLSRWRRHRTHRTLYCPCPGIPHVRTSEETQSMSPANVIALPSRRAQVSSEEWQLRVDLAAAYRLVALFKWDDLVFTHISARVPGPHEHFLINPYGLMFEEITASSLIKVDMHGNKLEESAYPV